MRFSNILLSTLVTLPLSYAQQAADGLIVPFTSELPACASNCGPLYDVQGACTPPNITTTDTNCFCTDTRLTAIGGDGTSGVSSVCGAAACTSSTDLQSVKTWYTNFCANKQANPTTTGGAAGTSTSKPTSSSGSGSSGGSGSDENENQTWIQGHWQWVIMIVIVTVGIIVIWVGAWLLRKRYLRKKEREFEMRPPVAWQPNTMAGANGEGAAGGRAGGHHKEAGSSVAPVNGKRLSKQKMGWFKAARV